MQCPRQWSGDAVQIAWTSDAQKSFEEESNAKAEITNDNPVHGSPKKIIMIQKIILFLKIEDLLNCCFRIKFRANI